MDPFYFSLKLTDNLLDALDSKGMIHHKDCKAAFVGQVLKNKMFSASTVTYKYRGNKTIDLIANHILVRLTKYKKPILYNTYIVKSVGGRCMLYFKIAECG